MSERYLLGVTLSSIGVVASSLGETAQRSSRLHAEKTAASSVKPKPPWRRPLWFLGILLVLVSAPLDAASFIYAPMSTIIVLYALKQPLLVLLAWVVLKERISVLCLVGILLCAAGAALSLANAPNHKEFELDTPGDFFTQAITSYLLASLCSCLMLGIMVCRSPRKLRNSRFAVQDLALPLLAAWCLGVEKMFNSGMGLVSEDVRLWDVEWIWMPLAVVALGALELFLNVCGLERMSTHVFMPIRFGFNSLIISMQGALFGEFMDMPQDAFAWWLLGLFGAVTGTMLVAMASAGVGDSALLEPPIHLEAADFLPPVDDGVTAGATS